MKSNRTDADVSVAAPRSRFPSVSFTRFPICVLMVVLAGCTHTTVPDLPKYVPGEWQHADSRPGTPTPPLDTWWSAFEDPALDQLIAAAQRDNLTVQMAAEKLKAARHLHHRARADFWPNLNFRVYEETAPGGQTGFLEMGFDTTWELGLFGRSQATGRISAADVNSATIDAAAARISVSAEVARTYVELCTARDRAQVIAEIATSRGRQLELAQTRLRLHLVSRSDVDRVHAEWEAAQREIPEAAVPIAEAEAALSVLLGRRVSDADLPSTTATPELHAAVSPQPPADLVRTRPEIRRAEQNVLRAAGELGIARADLYPRFSIVGTLISSTALTGDIDHPNKAVPLIGPAVTLPLIDWHSRRAIASAREAALTAAVLAYREAVLEGVAEVEAALARFDAKTSVLATADESVATAGRTYETTTAARKIGVLDDSDIATAKLALLQAELQRLQDRRDRALAFIAMYKAFGGSLPPLVTPP